MRLLPLALLALAWRAEAATTVTGTISLPDGSAATGRAYIDLTGTCIGSGGRVISNPTKIVTFTAGVFSVALEPSSSCTPSQVYRVRYQIAGFNTPIEFWNVPDTPSTTISAVRVPGIPVQSGALGLSYLTGLSCKGDLIAYTGTTTVRVPCGTTGKVLTVDPAASSGVSWQTGGATYGSYSSSAASASTWTILGSAHGLGTCAIAYQVWISNLAAEPDTVTCDPATFDVTITFSSAQAGNFLITSDPAFIADNLLNGSLVSQVVAQPFTSAALVTVTHNLNDIVILRCYNESGQRLFYDVGTVLSANALTASFVGSPSGFCVAGR